MTLFQIYRHFLALFNQSCYAALIIMTVAVPVWCDDISHECLDRQEVYGRTTTIYLGSAVEPTIAVNPKNKNKMVAAWQQNRISNGASLEAGIS